VDGLETLLGGAFSFSPLRQWVTGIARFGREYFNFMTFLFR